MRVLSYLRMEIDPDQLASYERDLREMLRLARQFEQRVVGQVERGTAQDQRRRRARHPGAAWSAASDGPGRGSEQFRPLFTKVPGRSVLRSSARSREDGGQGACGPHPTPTSHVRASPGHHVLWVSTSPL
jgi:hypothetical protein